MLKINRQVVIEKKPETIRSLYDRHAGMLLGYIYEVVKDRRLAEELLVQLFCELSEQFDNINWVGTNSWCQLQRFAKEKLSAFHESVKDCEEPPASGLMMNGQHNSHLSQLTEEQKQIFCAIYYHGKSIAEISKELKITEDLTRKALKEAFAIMRKGGEN